MKNPIKLWLDALRSSEFPQGKNTLDQNEFCCLGVACKVQVKYRLYGNSLREQWLGLDTSESYNEALGENTTLTTRIITNS